MVREIFYTWRQAERNRTNFTETSIMSRSSKIIIGVISVLPILFIAGILITIFFEFTNGFGDADSEPSIVFRNFGLIGGISFILSIGLLVYFIALSTKNKKMDSTERAIWILVFVLGGIISYPIYWYMKIWKDDL